jgi:type I restriction enzyme S subunit
LRFPEFIEPWDSSTIGECCSSLEYGMNAAAKEFDGINKYIRITDIDENTSTYSKQDVVSPSGVLEDKYLVRENDILFARTGASVGKTYHYDKTDGKLYYAGFLIRGGVLPCFNSKFIFYQTQLSRYKKWVTIMSARSGQPGINSQEYECFKLFIPTRTEQDKIATFIELLDKRIAVQSKLIEDLQQLKSALVERLYCQHNPNFKIGDLVVQVSKRNRGDNDYSVLSVNKRLGFIEQSEQFEDRSVASDDTSNYKVVSRDDFAYNPARINVGSIARLTSFDSGIVSPMYICFQTKRQILPQYLEHFFDTRYFYYEMQKRLEGSVRLCLSWEGLCNIPLEVPAVEQQEKVSKRISQLADKISLEERHLNLLKSQKQYLLQAMFI